MERAMKSLCFFRPRARIMTSPVGGRAGGRGREDGAGEEGMGEDGREGGGGGQGVGEASGDEGDVIVWTERATRY